MALTSNPLPAYKKPPVIEVVCGVQFDSLDALTAPLLGIFWQSIRDEYPKTQSMPPLGAVVERIPKAHGNDRVQVEVVETPPLPRTFFVHRSENWVMQIQGDRFLHNWRRTSDADEYPRFPAVFPKFWNAWLRFREFCMHEGLGELTANQLELTYINHISLGVGWQTLAGVGNVLPDIKWRTSERFLPNPESMAWNVSFRLPEDRGRLHVVFKHAIRRVDSVPVLLCELTARGAPLSNDEPALRDWFNMGREWIVRGFADLTDERIQHELWERTE
jgi:uncharacterized protein (TIGR04255 family)